MASKSYDRVIVILLALALQKSVNFEKNSSTRMGQSANAQEEKMKLVNVIREKLGLPRLTLQQKSALQTSRILRDFGWLWSVRGRWTYGETIVIDNLRNPEGANEVLLFKGLPSVFIHEVWVHCLGYAAEAVIRVEMESAGKSWALSCMRTLAKERMEPTDIVDIVVVEPHGDFECFYVHHQKTPKSGLLGELLRDALLQNN